jgi:hypothetical protein
MKFDGNPPLNAPATLDSKPGNKGLISMFRALWRNLAEKDTLNNPF